MHKIAADLISGAEKNRSRSGFLNKEKKEEAAFLDRTGTNPEESFMKARSG